MGVQKSQANHYDVAVDIQHVDLKNYTLCGYLRISGLTALYPEIITFFEGEIIGPKHSFLTRKWQANSSVDENHWQRFPSFTPYLDTFNKDGFSYNPLEEDCVFMRWKERFLVPDHHVSNIDGASYAGFYYICYSRSTKTIHGLYYYRSNVEWYQELTLYQASNSMGQFASLEFR
ncbi:vacuolar import/degradation protein Vid24 [Gongronella butleri]|nr:vacuolar import/degradation protein Vid24 [Gongronella butleri]